MKIYKLIQTHEAQEGDLFIATGANNFFGREVLNNEQALEYKPEDVAFEKTRKKKLKNLKNIENLLTGKKEEKPKKCTFRHIAKIKKMKEEGKTSAQIAGTLGLTLAKVNEHFV